MKNIMIWIMLLLSKLILTPKMGSLLEKTMPN